MPEAEIELSLERAKEKFPQARPRVISANGPQFIAPDGKEFSRLAGRTHVRTSPFSPQSNGQLERWPPSLKAEGLRPGCHGAPLLLAVLEVVALENYPLPDYWPVSLNE
jgi:transposase InsO family protein